MRFIFLLWLISYTSLMLAQENSFANKKSTDNSFGIYAGVCFFQNTKPIGNPNYSSYHLSQNTSCEPLLYFKHKRHQFMMGPTIMTPYIVNNYFIDGGALFYQYHFGNKSVHLFAEGNIREMRCTVNNNAYSAPYNQNNMQNGGGFSDAKLNVLVAHAVLGLEIKIVRFLYAQLAFGPGYYFIHSKPGFQVYTNVPDPFNLNTKDNFYKNHSGLDLYGRIGLAWRIHTF